VTISLDPSATPRYGAKGLTSNKVKQMSYTLGQAANATGKAKTTIQRAIKKGKISASRNESGGYVIDPAELHRVFPPVATPEDTTSNPRVTALEQQLQAIQQENRLLQVHLDEVREDRDHWRQQATILLNAPSQKNKSLWERLFNK
jgi:polyhydroxyalkanoate synthesis regulator phasin